ncbi:unnamed protein product, partial [Mesorhabditis belari]|uniref:Uncharacterized protein n=1 Tax=Mesorhabditis belari TaxID=2138241 RepID=A0AAF3FCL4_9BILA
MRTLATVYQGDKDLRKHMSKGNCWEMQKHELLYMKQFIDSYKGKPKFGINWSNTLTHDDANLLFHADEDFLTFFQENQKKLENSFIILVGDHGMRFGSVSQTTLGKREIKNPLLQITVP